MKGWDYVILHCRDGVLLLGSGLVLLRVGATQSSVFKIYPAVVTLTGSFTGIRISLTGCL